MTALWLCACTGPRGAVGVDPGGDLCVADVDCDAFATICAADGRCAQCASDTDCIDDDPYCVSGKCVACRDTVDCDGDEPICAPDGDCLAPCPIEGCETDDVCHPDLGACVDCTSDADCEAESPRCDPVSLECVDCVDASDCGGVACIEGDCAECTRDEDCPTGLACTASLECD